MTSPATKRWSIQNGGRSVPTTLKTSLPPRCTRQDRPVATAGLVIPRGKHPLSSPIIIQVACAAIEKLQDDGRSNTTAHALDHINEFEDPNPALFGLTLDVVYHHNNVIM